jgi:hypothetical protein
MDIVLWPMNILLIPLSSHLRRSLLKSTFFLLACLLLPFPAPAIQEKTVTTASKKTSNPIRLPATLKQVTHWSTGNYTRIVLELDRSVTWQARKLDPEKGQKTGRIYIDLSLVRLGHDVRNVTIHDQVIEGVRLGQYKPDVVRVVLDTEHIDRYKVFLLSDPARLVIYVWGEGTIDFTPHEQINNLTLPLPVEVEQVALVPPVVSLASAPTCVPALPTTKETNDNVATGGKGDVNLQKKGKISTSKSETLLLEVTINTQRLPEIVHAEKLTDGRLALSLDG